MQKENKGFNKRVFSLLMCIIAAFALWVYVIYIEDPATNRWETGIPVNVTGEAKLHENGLAIKDISVDKIDVELSAQRSRFKFLSSDSVTATLDVSKITSEGTSNIEISAFCPSDFTIISKRKATATVEVEAYIADKTFEIKPNIVKEPSNGYYVKSTTIDGNDLHVLVSGAESQVNSINRITTTDVDLSTIASDAVISVNFIPLDADGNTVENVALSIESANLTFVIYKIAVLPVEVTYYSGADNPNLTCTPGVDFVTVTGPAAEVDKLSTIQTQPISEYKYSAGSEATVSLSIPESITLYDRESAEITLNFAKNQ